MEHINTLKAARERLLRRPDRPVGVVRLSGARLDRLHGHRLHHRLLRRLRSGEWSSKVARDGIWHKLGAVVAVIVAGILDLLVGSLLAHFPGLSLPFSYEVFLCPLVVVWYILTECGSIIENAGALGAKIPGWLTRASPPSRAPWTSRERGRIK